MHFVLQRTELLPQTSNVTQGICSMTLPSHKKMLPLVKTPSSYAITKKETFTYNSKSQNLVLGEKKLSCLSSFLYLLLQLKKTSISNEGSSK